MTKIITWGLAIALLITVGVVCYRIQEAFIAAGEALLP
jgi:hypothetical protein